MEHTNKEWLYHQYIELGKSMGDIGNDVGRDIKTISYWLKKLDIPIRNYAYQSEYRTNKNRIKLVCDYCGCEFSKSPARAGRRLHQFCSRDCGYKFRRKVEKSNNQNDRKLYSYTNWKKDVLKRDNNECQKCGAIEKLHVHHLLPYSEYEDLRLDIDNGITLCSKCHYETHRLMNEMKIWSKP